ncbi:MAG: CAP domain-containing protein, partial [Verrucomicrobiae bacterium]|nr:CAP domain-containing protein [Verrucomicrobiae bacterium]
PFKSGTDTPKHPIVSSLNSSFGGFPPAALTSILPPILRLARGAELIRDRSMPSLPLIIRVLASHRLRAYPPPMDSTWRRVLLWAGVFPGLWIAVQAEPKAPPPAVRGERTAGGGTVALSSATATEPAPYDIGSPTDEEQLYLELINRSRADPAAEGARLASLQDPAITSAYDFFGVDLARMESEVAAYAAGQPLSFEPRLIAAARGHTAWMQANGIQSHDEIVPPSGPVLNTTGDRISASGYPWQRYGESIFAYAESEEFGHAGFVVDWGLGEGGVQRPPGHRESNFEPAYREVGIGVLNGTGPNGTGPQFVTLDFSARQNPSPLVTGAVYFDLNGNDFYDLGEGVGDVRIAVGGANAYAVSAGSGGYSVPAANGTRLVTATWQGTTLGTASATVSGGLNAKVDFRLAYTPPQLAGPSAPVIHRTNVFTYSPVPGAVAYQWRNLARQTLPEYTAEAGLSDLTLNAPGSPFPVVQGNGGSVYHLTHAGSLAPQELLLNATVQPSATAEIQFQHQIGFAGDGEVVRLQAQEEDGPWTDLWTLRGDNGAGASGFSTETVSLAPLAGRFLRFRFVYDFIGGTYYDQPNLEVGILLDNIVFRGAEAVIAGPLTEVAAGAPVEFVPTVLGTYELVVRPVRSQGFWPWGPSLRVVAGEGSAAAPVISGVRLGSDGRLAVEFSVTGTLTALPVLQRAAGLEGGFDSVVATLRTNAPGSYSFQYEPEGSQGFLRVALP